MRKGNTKTAIEGAKPEAISSSPFAPELCRSQKEPPRGDDWLHETKWDGYRIVASVADGRTRLWSRNAIEWTHKVPELAAAISKLKLRSAQLDGEMIVLRDGRDDFNALQSRLSAKTKEPAVYVLFDIPHLNGQSLRAVPLIKRKQILEDILLHPHPLLRYSEHVVGHGEKVFAQASNAGIEGIVSKRCISGYRGDRNGDWVKVKGRPSDEFVVVGFTEPKGSRSGIGALLLARHLSQGNWSTAVVLARVSRIASCMHCASDWTSWSSTSRQRISNSWKEKIVRWLFGSSRSWSWKLSIRVSAGKDY